MSKKLFTCKEHYLAFHRAWADACHDDRAKKQIKEAKVKSWPDGSIYIRKYRTDSWLTASHMVLYNLLRDKPITDGFTPIHDVRRLAAGHHINLGFYQAAIGLWFVVENARRSLIPPADDAKDYVKRNHQHRKENVEKFLEPFGGTVTLEMLAKVDIPRIEPLYTGFGKGATFAGRIANGERFTMEELLPHMVKEE